MTEKKHLYPNLRELLQQLDSEKDASEIGGKSEISEPPPGYDEIFRSYISEESTFMIVITLIYTRYSLKILKRAYHPS